MFGRTAVIAAKAFSDGSTTIEVLGSGAAHATFLIRSHAVHGTYYFPLLM